MNSSNDRFIEAAKEAVVIQQQEYHKHSYDAVIPRPDDLYVVWFSKTLDNWKALISTDVIPSAYWEVTYNGSKQEAYVDHYVKVDNKVIPATTLGLA